MATIPIEVIVQDAKAPIVPGEDGTNNTETNITVPDTGTISNNGETSSSASSIILPAILLVLAIGSIVVILIHRYRKQEKSKLSKKEKLVTSASATIAVLAIAVLVGNLLIPATKAATSDATDSITPAEDKISITVTRDSDSAEASIESTATITSTSDFGYKVLLSMAENADNANLYLDSDANSEYYIAATESAELNDNTWGFALTEDGEYAAVPLVDNAAIVAQGNEAVEDEALSIYYGVMVNSALPTGTYSGEIEYTLEAMPSFPDTLVYMQDMTPEICAAAPTPGNSVTDPVPTATLIDVRDNKTYTIAKLADGNCWMTQNLDLDLSTDVTLTPANTNISSDWTPVNNTIAFTGTTLEGWQNSSIKPYSADPGDIYFYTSNNDEADIRYDSLADCEEAGHTDCSHYHAGNYYNWSAAIASNDSSAYTELYTKADTSICPAGWRLPDGPDINNTYYSDIGNLLISYDEILEPEINIGCGGDCPFYNFLSGGLNVIRKRPIWLMRAGVVNSGTFGEYGYGGRYWSNNVKGSGNAFDGTFYSWSFNPAMYNARFYTDSVRCVAE